MYSEENVPVNDKKVSSLFKVWSGLLQESIGNEGELIQKIRQVESGVPKAPHLENCKASVSINHRLDTRLSNVTYPPWTIWKGMLDDLPQLAADDELKHYRDQIISEGAYPPWV